MRLDLSVKEEEFVTQLLANKSNPISKATNQRSQDNQQEYGISNQVCYPRNKLYRDFLQDWLHLNKNMPGQEKSELFT